MFGQPTLLPMSVYACPNETVAFTCSDSQIVAVQWKLDMYIEQGADQLTFIFSDPVGTQAIIYMGMISANISEVTRRNESVADITTTLTIITHGLLNKTNISCITSAANNAIISSSSSVFYFAGIYVN